MESSESHEQYQELYLQEIEAVDDYWGPTFRSLYESQLTETFISTLELRIQEHNANIEKMCHFHYQGFISSVRDLLLVRGDAERLNSEVVQIDFDLRASGSKVFESGKELVRARRIEKNIIGTIESLSLCLPVLQTFSKLSKIMKEKKYHSALKTLEQLEHTFLPRIANYRFSKQMKAAIPNLRLSIKVASLSELKDFLEEVRVVSGKIGRNAMEGKEAYPEKSVDFKPLYRCLHIYTVLGEREDFEKDFRKQRWQQISLFLESSLNMTESVEKISNYLHGLLGFFLCETHILRTANGLLDKSHVDDIWSFASREILSTLTSYSSYATNSDYLLELKLFLLTFSSKLSSSGLNSDKFTVYLAELREHYTEILNQKWVSYFREIFELDNYHPIEVFNSSEYSQVLSSFPFHSRNLETLPFPKSFPFSQMVPRVYCKVKDFIDSISLFTQDLNLSMAEIDETLRKSTNILLTRTLSGCLSSLLQKNNLSLLQLIQININTYHLEASNLELEKYISILTSMSLESNHVARLQGRSIFKDIRAEAEQEIHYKLISKMDEFIELAHYEWLLPEAQGMSSPWLMDLIAFLRSVFLSFTNLPVKLAQMTCMTACQYLSKSILKMILHDSVKALSLGVLHQIDLDVVQCEMFASSQPVPDLEEDVLLSSFLDLRQLLDLFVSWDWSTYFADYGNGNEGSKYLRVQPAIALAIFDKLKEAEKKSHVFAIMNKKDRDKKRLVDTIYKQLKNLTSESSS